ncbi:unnamed protein product [Angiostrongylus costaricensis]|uniref:ATP synthase subunit d, mitochondrial n=1 Tax=Angiostrongylus costaricensis TaxID=334426 RepID=A0A158PEQ6_ANGCS|nr:unnamed protein product [Angiostrongylus costaricensis]
MSGSARIAASSVNWAKLGLSLRISSCWSVLPRLWTLHQVDFNALKKQMPAHSAILDSLQKQLESIKIPYGEIPKKFLQEIDHWTEYNNERIKFHDIKVADGLEEAKKVEAKWASAPPVEHFNRQHFVEYFPQEFYDLRYQNR